MQQCPADTLVLIDTLVQSRDQDCSGLMATAVQRGHTNEALTNAPNSVDRNDDADPFVRVDMRGFAQANSPQGARNIVLVHAVLHVQS
jgi:hypothetical protein